MSLTTGHCATFFRKMECACFTWIPHFWNQLFGTILSPFGTILSHKNQVVVTVPHDVIPNILSRLPADQAFECRTVCKEWRALTSTPYFVDMNLKRSTPLIFMQSRSKENWNKMNYFIFDEHAKKNMMFKRMDCMSGHSMSKMCPWIVGSCNGLLLFRGGDFTCLQFFICNPITQEHDVVSLPPFRLGICGFFFNSFRVSYCVLVYTCGKGHLYHYAIYSPRAKWRPLGNFKLCPVAVFPPSIVNGALHWMTDSNSYGVLSCIPCTEAIFIFNMEEEKFSLRPHPGRTCVMRRGSYERHNVKMRLLEIEEQLSFCDVGSDHIDIWVLQDYADWIWVKRFKVNLNFKRNVFDDDKCYFAAANLVNIQNNELLLTSNDRLAFRYHIQQHTIRKFYIPKSLDVSFDTGRPMNTYIKSLVSLKNL